MNVLVTGAAGLYGAHMIQKLLSRDDIEKIIGVDNYSRKFLRDPLRSLPKNHPEKFELRKIDFRTIESKFLDKEDIDIVFHFAAYISIDESMKNATKYFENNELGTFQLLQSLFHSKSQPYLIYASSPEVYGNPVYLPMDVNHPMYPRSIYATTKLAAEKHCHAMHQWYGYPVAIIRNFNTYGENQNIGDYAGVVHKFIVKALSGKPLQIHNDGKQTRDFIYIKDAVAAYEKLMVRRKENNGEIFNLGTGRQTSILELAQKIKELTQSSSELVFKSGRSADLAALCADISKTRQKLDWEQKYTLEEGLRRTISWYKSVG